MSTLPPLLPTGVSGLDIVLGGGLSRGSLVFLVGMSGAGKTVLGSQILYSAAHTGVPVLILTAFSESHVKLLEHLRPFAFCDPDLVGASVTLLSIQSLLGNSPETAATAIIRAIRESGARLVLIDGFQGFASLLHDRDAVRQMVASLAGQLPYLDVILLVTLDGPARDPGLAHELATADVVIGLDYRVEGWRHLRRLEIIKQRGRRALPGLHSYDITQVGISVYPRLEAVLRHSSAPASAPGSASPAAFGLPELDSLLNGGLDPRTITLLVAAPGVGKTLLGLHWALAPATSDGATPGKTIYLTFHEHPEQLRHKASTFGLPLEQALSQETIELIRILPIELSPDQVAAQIVAATSNSSAQRLVIDDLEPLLAELGLRARDFLSALKELLYHADVTCLLLLEIAPLQGLHLELDMVPLSLIADNVIMVQQTRIAGALHRMLAILKTRFSSHDPELRELVIADSRIRVLRPAETAPGVLSTIPPSATQHEGS